MPAVAKTDARVVEREDPQKELETLGAVVTALESVSGDQRGRMFRYLKDRYSADWPHTDY